MTVAENSRKGLVGRGVSRVDASDKVRGLARYADDLDVPGCWHGVIVRSPVSRGTLRSVKLDPACDASKAVVVTARDIPGPNVVHMHDRTMPLLAEIGGEIRYRGEPVAVVAAKTPELAAEAAKRIRVEIDELPPLLTLQDGAVTATCPCRHSKVISPST